MIISWAVSAGRALKVRPRILKSILIFSLLLGVAVTYTAYKTAAPTKQAIAESIKEDLMGIKIRKSSEEGIKIIVLYQAATTKPTLENVSALFKLTLAAWKEKQGVVKFAGRSNLDDPGLPARILQYQFQLNFLEKPITSGFILGGAALVTLYLIALILKSLAWILGASFGTIRRRFARVS